MIAYKAAKTLEGDICVLITLEIPEDALTNCNRSNIAVKEYAEYRANKVKVLKIEDENGKEYETAKTGFYINKKLIYKLNEVVEEPDFDNNLDKVCSTGIHFVLTKRCAELYNLKRIEKGLYQQWYENGQKEIECAYVNGAVDGLCQTWYENENKHFEYTYKNGVLEGLCQTWYDNGQKWKEFNFVNGVKDGLYQEWHSNGQKEIICMYVNGLKEGVCQAWFSDGEKSLEFTYVNGEIV